MAWKEKIHILLVDDQPANLLALEAVLSHPDYQLIRAHSGREALACVQVHDFAVILLDVMMPVLTGFETAIAMRQYPRSKSAPIIFMTANASDDSFAAEAYSAGAVDFLLKPFNPAILKSKVAVFADLYRKTQELKEVELRKSRDQFKTIFENVADGILVQDPTFRCMYANQRGAKLCGFSTSEELLDAPVSQALEKFDIFDENGGPFPIEKLPARLVFQGVAEPLEIVMKAREKLTGQIRWSVVSSRPIHDDQGAVSLAVSIFRDITEQRQAQEDLKRSHEGLEKRVKERTSELEQSRRFMDSLIENIPDMIFVKDAKEFRFVRLNKAGEELLGFSQNELIGKNDYDFFPKEQADHFAAKDRAVIAGRGLLDIAEEPIQAKNGPRILHTKKIPLFGSNGEPQYLLGISEDITARKKNEEEKLQLEALKKSEARFRAMADFAPVFIWIAGPDKRSTWFNRPWLEFTGRKLEQEIGEGWTHGIHPDDKARYLDEYQAAFDARRSFRLEYRLRNRHGGYRWLVDNGTPHYGENGAFLGYIGSCFDITDRKSAETALRFSESNSRFLAEAGAVLASSLDYQSTLKAIARFAVPRLADWCAIDLLSENPENPVPSSVAIVHPDPEKLKLAAELREKYPTDWGAPSGAPAVLRSGKSELYPQVTQEMLRASARDEAHFKLIDALCIRSVMIVPLIAREKTLGVITLVSAESGKNFSELDLRTAEDLARRAGLAVDNARLYAGQVNAREVAEEALRTREEFLSVASHELKTPITSLKLQIQMTQKQLLAAAGAPLSPEKLAKTLSTSDRQVDRLTTLVDDLLDVSRISAGKLSYHFEETDLAQLLHEVGDRFAAQLQSAGCLIEIDAPEPVIAACDRFRIDQVMTNLMSNAVKYAAGKPIFVKVRKSHGKASVSVQDFGMGIDSTKQGKIFDRFERAVSSRNISGLGLGLFIAREIVLAHHGEIHVESELGKGSTFTVTLPLKG